MFGGKQGGLLSRLAAQAGLPTEGLAWKWPGKEATPRLPVFVRQGPFISPPPKHCWDEIKGNCCGTSLGWLWGRVLYKEGGGQSLLFSLRGLKSSEEARLAIQQNGPLWAWLPGPVSCHFFELPYANFCVNALRNAASERERDLQRILTFCYASCAYCYSGVSIPRHSCWAQVSLCSEPTMYTAQEGSPLWLWSLLGV